MEWLKPSNIMSTALYIASTICSCVTPFLDDTTQVTVFAVAIMLFGIGWLIRRFDIFKV